MATHQLQKHPAAPTKQARTTPDGTSTVVSVDTTIRDLGINGELCVERLQMLLDAVSDAVIQTQDVSAFVQQWAAKQANNVQQLTVSSILCDALLLIATDGLAGVIDETMTTVVKDALTKLFLHNEAFAALTTTAAAAAIDKALGGLPTSVDLSGSDFGLFSRGVRQAAQKGFEQFGDALRRGVKSQLAPASNSTLAGTDLPRTAITRAVQAYVSAHRLALRVELLEIAYLIRSGGMTPAQASTLVGKLAIGDVTSDLDQLRDQFALGFEAVIWSQIYAGPLQKADYEIPTQVPSGHPTTIERLPSGGSVYMSDIPGVLVDYWRSRFPDALNAYYQSYSQSPFAPTKGVSADVQALYELFQNAKEALDKRLKTIDPSGLAPIGTPFQAPQQPTA